MSEFHPIICQECYEDRNLVGTFASRFSFGAAVIGICDICYERTVCVCVTPAEAMSFAQREIRVLKWIGAGLALALLLVVAYVVADRNYGECRGAGFSKVYCVTKNFIR